MRAGIIAAALVALASAHKKHRHHRHRSHRSHHSHVADAAVQTAPLATHETAPQPAGTVRPQTVKMNVEDLPRFLGLDMRPPSEPQKRVPLPKSEPAMPKKGEAPPKVTAPLNTTNDTRGITNENTKKTTPQAVDQPQQPESRQKIPVEEHPLAIDCGPPATLGREDCRKHSIPAPIKDEEIGEEYGTGAAAESMSLRPLPLSLAVLVSAIAIAVV